ncbi:MAG: helix-turn-helix domain-containing protein [Sedimentisphaerales bacterium]|nr:helix-turn-helix domain-containing protein [Sedimentisphaerales bacterium]
MNGNPQSSEPIVMSIKDTAQRLAVSEKILRSLTCTGRIRSVRIGRRCVKYDLRDVQAFIDGCKGSG